jgi:hypothetical protein
VRQIVRYLVTALALALCGLPVRSATLERLSMDELVAQSTAIVRARAGAGIGQFHGSVIYTHYSIHVSQQYKGSSPATMDIVVPGGAAFGVRQDVGGAPALTPGEEYVFFLWTGKSGLTHIMGLTQGLFALGKSVEADPVAVRNASTELMIDRATGQVVRDQKLSFKLSELRTVIATRLKGNVK